jgi:hypothetical protein
MKTKRVTITLGQDSRTLIKPGIWEDGITWTEYKAYKEQAYASRQDKLYSDGLQISARYKIRLTPNVQNSHFKYLSTTHDTTLEEYTNIKNISRITEDSQGHWLIIEVIEKL